MDVAVVGAGTVGTALAVLLSRAGHRITAASGRKATRERLAEHLPEVPLVKPAEVASAGDVIFITTPDDRIEAACREVASGELREGAVVAHVSGAGGLDLLDAARDAGAGVLCVHPLQTFPSVGAAIRRLPGAAIAITARDEETAALGELLALDVGGEPFRLAEDAKPLYHAAAVFASNYLVAVTAAAESLMDAAGIADGLERLLPLQRATLENIADMGAANALTGPAVRGDAGTVARNIDALANAAPTAIAPYVTLAGLSLDLAERSGRLASDARAGVEEVLARWT